MVLPGGIRLWLKIFRDKKKILIGIARFPVAPVPGRVTCGWLFGSFEPLLNPKFVRFSFFFLI